MQNQIKGNITIKLFRQMPTSAQLQEFQIKHYTKRLSDAKAKILRDWAEISFLRKELKRLTTAKLN